MIRSLVWKLPVFLAFLLAAAAAPAADFVKLVQSCEKCHGKDGNSTTPDVPIIAGYSPEGFLNTMDVFRAGERVALKFHKPGEPETVMNDIAKGLSDKDVRDLADYFSKRPFKPAQQSVNAEFARRGEVIHKRFCEKCHTDGGAHPVEDAAILAGQWTPYLKRQFDNFLSGKRKVPRTMLRRIQEMPKDDIEALLHFYAGKGMQER
jgi:sulfide dehydrogenase cytochrome subunit